jgi:hypothetical protein
MQLFTVDLHVGGDYHLEFRAKPVVLVVAVQRDSVLFIGTRFSNLYTAVDTPAEAA